MTKRKLYLLAAFASLFLVTFILYFGCSKGSVFGGGGESPLKNDADVEKAWDIQRVFAKIYDLYKERVVFISTEQEIILPYDPIREYLGYSRVQKQTGLGSGFVLSSDGYICTNFHVIAPNGYVVDKITVVIGEDTYQAKVRGFDDSKDVALLKIEPKKALQPVFIGNSSEVKVGDWAIAIGNPFGLDKSFTVGVISATGRRNIEGDNGDSFLQTDAAINPGNSGGPLINIRGEVIGINRMIYSKSGGYMGIGFAIPITEVGKILTALKEKKFVQKGYIGIALRPLDRRISQYLGWENNYGVLVDGVLSGGPADRAGLERGDIVISVNGKKVTSSSEFLKEIEKAGAGNRVTIVAWRNGQAFQFNVTAISKPVE